MIKQLTKLANHLDSKGLSKEADYLDAVIRKIADTTPAGLAYILNQMFKGSRHDGDEVRKQHVSSLKAVAGKHKDYTVISFTIDSLEQYYAFSGAKYNGPHGNGLLLNIEGKMQNDIGGWQYEAGTDLLSIGKDSQFPFVVRFFYSESHGAKK